MRYTTPVVVVVGVESQIVRFFNSSFKKSKRKQSIEQSKKGMNKVWKKKIGEEKTEIS